MANGEDAAAAGMDVVPSTAKVKLGYDEINKTRDYVAQFFANVKTWAQNLFVPKTDVVVSDGSQAIANKIPRYSAAGRMIVGYPATDNDVTNKAYVDTTVAAGVGTGFVKKSGDTMTGDLTISGSGNHLFVPSATTVSTSYVAGYINGDGRLGKTPSSRRYKRDITPLTPAQLAAIRDALLRLQLVEFYLRDEVLELDRPKIMVPRVTRAGYVDEVTGLEVPDEITYEAQPDRDWMPPKAVAQLGLIAEDLVDAGLPWLVFVDEHGRPDGIHYDRLCLALLPVVQDLDARLTHLEHER